LIILKDLPTSTFELVKPLDIVLTRSWEIHMIMLMWIALKPWAYVNPSFYGSKNFLTFQMRYAISEGRLANVFNDGIGHLW
jgi:hypothetical protein